jgi:TRAP-type C4-dicarboxylate transport system permease small subunit
LTISIISIIIYILNESNITNIYRGWSSAGHPRIFIAILTTAFVPWFYSSASLFINSENKRELLTRINLSSNKSMIIFILTTISLLFIAGSKGFALGIIVYSVLSPLLFYLPELLKAKLNKNLPVYLSIIIILFILLLSLGYGDLANKIFASEDISNKTRYDQMTLILKDLNFLGNGLGATIEGLIRDSSAPYGVELTYLNLIHKFGFMSVILFIGWTYMFFRIIRKIIKRQELPYNIAALGALGYMFPSIGNPMLMHPGCVIMNCLALYLTRTDEG